MFSIHSCNILQLSHSHSHTRHMTPTMKQHITTTYLNVETKETLLSGVVIIDTSRGH